MRHIMTAIWSLLIAAAVSFVLSSMAGENFILGEAIVLAVILLVFTVLIGDGVLREKRN